MGCFPVGSDRILVMASPLPATQESTPPLARVIEQLARKGYGAAEVAKKLAPNNPRKQKNIRRQFRRIIGERPSIAYEQSLITKGVFLEEMEQAAEAVARRAKRGRVDAAKLMLEVTGLHNPRVKHEHSGDININLKGLTRPPAVETEDSVVDADVVED